MGLIKLLRENIPGLIIHASTQTTLANSDSIKIIENMGVSRAVLPRELTLKEIKQIRNKTALELEVFVHGALCVCYSGQCLMSSFIGGRSGNRGLCAQPCRLPWSLSENGKDYGKSSYLISPRDLMAIELLPQLKNAGVYSLKLEGRMKSPEYVAIVTSIYRKYVDMLEELGEDQYKVEEADKEILMQAFNRGGFTKAYLEGSRNFKKLVYPRHQKNQGILLGKVLDTKPLYIKVKLDKHLDMGDGLEVLDDEKGVYSFIVTSIVDNNKQVRTAQAGTEVWIGDVKTSVKKGSMAYKTLSKPLFEEARQTFEKKETPVVPLNMEFNLRAGERAKLRVIDVDHNFVDIESEIIAEKALNKALSNERIKQQLNKTGDTPYYLQNMYINSDDDSIIPISALNSMRREALEEIKNLRIEAHKKHALAGFKNLLEQWSADKRNNKKSDVNNKVLLSAFFYSMPNSLEELNDMVNRVYLPVLAPDILKKLKEKFSGEIYIWTPSILKDPELLDLKEELQKLISIIDGIAFGNFGVYKTCKEFFPHIPLCAESSMNVFNNSSIEVHENLNVATVVLSPELNLKEVREIKPNQSNLEAIIYGRIPLMTMEHCPSSLEMPCSCQCGSCTRSKGLLKDRKGEIFPFIRDPILKRTQIFNAYPFFMDDINSIKETEVKILRLVFTNEDKSTRKALAEYFNANLLGSNNYNSQIKDVIDKLKDTGFTKGHWFRGVD